MTRVAFTLFFCFTFISQVFSQKEYNIWYFGERAGLDFNSGAPVVLTNSAMNTNEGCASISDHNGQLLFYSDGITVWNRNHVPMTNGTGLMGHISAMHSGFAVQKPGSLTIYYIFTVDAYENNLQNGFRYSIVDMTLSNGLGAITQKNILVQASSTEKIAVTTHANGIDRWVIMHKWNSNTFSAYLLSSAGLSATPVNSNVGTAHQGSFFNGIGDMKVSPDGSRLALAIRDMHKFELFNFNKSTGIISNPTSSSSVYGKASGVEFSPDGTKLYTSSGDLQKIYQFNLANSSPLASPVVIATFPDIVTGLLTGPDGKIYCVQRYHTHLSVINKPNLAGAASNFVLNGLSLGGRRAWFSLPCMISNKFLPIDFTFSGTCVQSPVNFSATGVVSGSSINWNFGDPASGSANTSIQINPSHTFSSPGSYSVTLTVNGGGSPIIISKIVMVKPIPVNNLGKDTTLCAGQTLLLGKPPVSGQTYLWQNGSVNSTLLVNAAGNYSLQVTQNGCTAGSSIKVNYINDFNFSLGNDTTLCDGQKILLGSPAIQGLIYEWQDGSKNSTFLASQAGLYTLTVKNAYCKTLTSSKRLTYSDCTPIIPNIITPNGDGYNDKFALKNMQSGIWEVRFFNRWGTIIFESEDYKNTFGFNNLADGTYYYQIKRTGSEEAYKGWLQVVNKP